MASYPSTSFCPFWLNTASQPKGDRLELSEGGARLLVVLGIRGSGDWVPQWKIHTFFLGKLLPQHLEFCLWGAGEGKGWSSEVRQRCLRRMWPS